MNIPSYCVVFFIIIFVLFVSMLFRPYGSMANKNITAKDRSSHTPLSMYMKYKAGRKIRRYYRKLK